MRCACHWYQCNGLGHIRGIGYPYLAGEAGKGQSILTGLGGVYLVYSFLLVGLSHSISISLSLSLCLALSFCLSDSLTVCVCVWCVICTDLKKSVPDGMGTERGLREGGKGGGPLLEDRIASQLYTV